MLPRGHGKRREAGAPAQFRQDRQHLDRLRPCAEGEHDAERTGPTTYLRSA
jgi:hypothetical protein